MPLKYEISYKRMGVKTLSDLHSKLFDLKNFQLPLSTTIHNMTMDDTVMGQTDPLLVANKSRVTFVKNLDQLHSSMGNPQYKNRITRLNKAYFKENTRLKRLRTDLDKLPLQSIALYNYGSLEQVHVYKGDKNRVRIARWYNLIKTLTAELTLSVKEERYNIIVLDIPSKDLEESLIKRLKGKEIKFVGRYVRTGIDFFYYYLLQMSLGNTGLFTGLSKDTLAKTSVLIRNGKQGLLVSLAYLAMITPKDSETELLDNEVVKKSGIKDLKVSRPIPVLLNSFKSAGVYDSPVVVPEVEGSELEEIETVVDAIEMANVPDIDTPLSDDEALLSVIDKEAEAGTISAAVYRRLKQDVENTAALKNPFDKEITLNESIAAPIDINIVKENPVLKMLDIPDESMKKATIDSKTHDYITEHLSRHKLMVVNALKRAGIIIQDYQVTDKTNYLGGYEVHELTTKMPGGTTSKIIFRIPHINERGVFKVNDVEYLLKTQKSEKPIVKTSDDQVILTTYYYSKIMVRRSDLQTLSTKKKLSKAMTALIGAGYIKIDVSDFKQKVPYIYGVLASLFKTYQYEDIQLMLDYNTRLETFYTGDKNAMKKAEKGGFVTVGLYKNKDHIFIDDKNHFYRETKESRVLIGDIMQLLPLNIPRKLYDMAETKIFGKRLAVGVILGYLLGMSVLLKRLKVSVTVVPVSTRIKVGDSDFPPIVFNDVKLLIKEPDMFQSLILSAFIHNAGSLSQYDYSLFDKKDVWLNVVLDRGGSIRTLDEIELQNKMFIDPISKEILTLMKEPVTYPSLLLRAVYLLRDNTHHTPSATEVKLFKGYERIPGFLYSALTKSIREANNRLNVKRKKLEMSPHDLWNTILQDPSVEFLRASNPTQELKGFETGFLGGGDGRTKQTVTTKDRTYNEADIGVVSEATPDSSEVGSTFLLTPGAKLDNIYGMVSDTTTIKEPGSVLSTPALNSYGVQYDDPKRVMMISVQASHVIPINEGEEPYIKTGYEKVIVARSSDKFASVAKEKGKVLSRTKEGMIVEYASGDKIGIALGFSDAKSGGLYYPYETLTDLDKGDTFKLGDMLAYNESYIAKKGKTVNDTAIRDSVTARIALVEDSITFEDSSGITTALAKKLNAQVLDKRSYVLEFDKEIHQLLDIGDDVDPDTPLFIIEDALSAGFDKNDILSALEALTSSVPTAKVTGTIKNIVILYHGDKEDMSDTLRRYTDASDRRLNKKAKATNQAKTSGKVDGEYRVEGKPFLPNTVEILVYIQSEDEYGDGDKMIFAHQMKSTTSDVIDYPLSDEDDVAIDGFFSLAAIGGRLVTSPIKIGTAIPLLRELPNKLLELYKK